MLQTITDDLFMTDKLSNESVSARRQMIQDYAKLDACMFYFSHSGGKDSQSGYAELRSLVPDSKIVVVHACLGEVEHSGVIEHIQANTKHELNIVKNRTFIELVLLRGRFPSSLIRFCTSELKTVPINSFICKHMEKNGITIGVNVTGLRSAESKARAGKNPLTLNERMTLKDSTQRTVYDWMSTYHRSDAEVFEHIAESGQSLHPVYGDVVEGKTTKNSRLSCKFCILASLNDLRNAAIEYPDDYAMMVALEIVVNHTMFGYVKTFATGRQMNKNELLNGGVVTKSTPYKLKSKAESLTPFSTKVFLPTPLNEKVGVPVNDLKVQFYINKLRSDRKRLLDEKARDCAAKSARKEAEALAKAEKARDPNTIDAFKVRS